MKLTMPCCKIMLKNLNSYYTTSAIHGTGTGSAEEIRPLKKKILLLV